MKTNNKPPALRVQCPTGTQKWILPGQHISDLLPAIVIGFCVTGAIGIFVNGIGRLEALLGILGFAMAVLPCFALYAPVRILLNPQNIVVHAGIAGFGTVRTISIQQIMRLEVTPAAPNHGLVNGYKIFDKTKSIDPSQRNGETGIHIPSYLCDLRVVDFDGHRIEVLRRVNFGKCCLVANDIASYISSVGHSVVVSTRVIRRHLANCENRMPSGCIVLPRWSFTRKVLFQDRLITSNIILIATTALTVWVNRIVPMNHVPPSPLQSVGAAGTYVLSIGIWSILLISYTAVVLHLWRFFRLVPMILTEYVLEICKDGVRILMPNKKVIKTKFYALSDIYAVEVCDSGERFEHWNTSSRFDKISSQTPFFHNVYELVVYDIYGQYMRIGLGHDVAILQYAADSISSSLSISEEQSPDLPPSN